MQISRVAALALASRTLLCGFYRLTFKITGSTANTMVKPRGKSIKSRDGHGLLRVVELYVGGEPETEIEQ